MQAGSGSPQLPGKKLLEGDVTPEEVVVAYHERTKHHYHRFSASLGYMDWATQPDPFRRYDGALLVRLPLPDTWRALPYWQLYSLGSVAPMPLSIDSLSLFFRYALSLTRWKAFEGTTWSLAPIRRVVTSTRPKAMRSCRLSAAFTIVRPSITTPPKNTASSGVRTSTSRFGRR